MIRNALIARHQSIAGAALSLPVPLPETEGPQWLAILSQHSSKMSRRIEGR